MGVSVESLLPQHGQAAGEHAKLLSDLLSAHADRMYVLGGDPERRTLCAVLREGATLDDQFQAAMHAGYVHPELRLLAAECPPRVPRSRPDSCGARCKRRAMGRRQRLSWSRPSRSASLWSPPSARRARAGGRSLLWQVPRVGGCRGGRPQGCAVRGRLAAARRHQLAAIQPRAVAAGRGQEVKLNNESFVVHNCCHGVWAAPPWLEKRGRNRRNGCD